MMACNLSILDFEIQGQFQATTPEILARASRTWGADIHHFGPWTRRPSRFTMVPESYVWQPEKNGTEPTVMILENCSSTMDAAWHFIEHSQMRIWDSVLAVEQVSGRGRQKRQWISPAGNIHASWLWPLPGITGNSVIDWGGLLSLLAGFVFARVFKELSVPVKIKWPNDLLISDQKSDRDRKFAGILVERHKNNIVVGIGINLSHSPDDNKLREEFAVPATRLLDQGFEMRPLSLWTLLVEKGKLLFEQLIETLTPTEFIRLVDMQMAWVGKKVLIRQFNTDLFDAVILGVAEDGGLRIKKGTTEEVLYSGSIIPVR